MKEWKINKFFKKIMRECVNSILNEKNVKRYITFIGKMKKEKKMRHISLSCVQI